MPRSLAAGDYTLAAVYESASRADAWYRVCSDRHTGALSCDCPTWIFNQSGNRTCAHTDITAFLYPGQHTITQRTIFRDYSAYRYLLPLVQQWPGLLGQWSVDQRHSHIGTKLYFFVAVHFLPGNGGAPMSGVIAFSEAHHPTEEYMAQRIALWVGYALAAEVARRGGFPMAGQPPEHFTVQRRQPTTARSRTARVVPFTAQTRIGLSDILRVADETNLGDGLIPAQRAENTLRLFLGDELYGRVERDHFLDVSSVSYAEQQRVYRLRRDSDKRSERRVRVFREQSYWRDFCIVRGQSVPEADHYLTVFLGLLSDEQHTLSVVQNHNIFSPNSDGVEQEIVPAVWTARVT